MSVSSLLALLSLFAIPLQLILSLPNPDSRPGTIPRGPLEWGHGPQLEPAPQTKHLVWDSQLDMNKGKKVEVFSVETGDVVYTISELPHDYRTTIISNGQGMELLRFQLKKTATWDHAFVYHTSSAVSYEIHPRGKATDRWYMHVQGDNPETLKYYRGHSANTGNVYLRDTKLAAFQFNSTQQIDKSKMKPGALKGVQTVVSYQIVEPSDVPVHYFVGLWCLVKRRIDHYGV